MSRYSNIDGIHNTSNKMAQFLLHYKILGIDTYTFDIFVGQ